MTHLACFIVQSPAGIYHGHCSVRTVEKPSVQEMDAFSRTALAVFREKNPQIKEPLALYWTSLAELRDCDTPISHEVSVPFKNP